MIEAITGGVTSTADPLFNLFHLFSYFLRLLLREYNITGPSPGLFLCNLQTVTDDHEDGFEALRWQPNRAKTIKGFQKQ